MPNQETPKSNLIPGKDYRSVKNIKNIHERNSPVIEKEGDETFIGEEEMKQFGDAKIKQAKDAITKSEQSEKIFDLIDDKESEILRLKDEIEFLKKENESLRRYVNKIDSENNSKEYQEFIKSPQNKKEFDDLVKSLGFKECPEDQKQAIIEIIIQRRNK